MSTTVAVTGADGFIGSHLVEGLVAQGHRVRAMVLYNSLGTWGWLDDLAPEVLEHVEVVPGDVRDPRSVTDLLRGAEVAYHLAALIAIPYSYQAPQSYVQTNVLGTLNVLEAARDLGTPRVVHTSTSEVYGTARHVPMSEAHPLCAQSPYAASKIGADQLAESYHRSFDLPVVTLRPFNTYGPRQSARAVIPSLIAQIASGQPTLRVGALDPTRDFNFVQDTVQAFLAVGRAPLSQVAGQTLNAGSGTELSVRALVEALCRHLGRVVPIEQEEARLRPDASEVQRLVADSTELRARTGWRPEFPLEVGLARTADWFLQQPNLARYRPGVYAV